MWGSLDQLLLRLGHPSGASDLAVLERTFGPLAFVHLRRDGLQAIEPLVVTYEEVVSDPRAAVAGIAGHLSVELPQGWRPRSEHRKQADEINGAHEEALREALGAEGS
jgi:LPS sulfotransferase NodH